MTDALGYFMVAMSVGVAILISELVKRHSRIEREEQLPHRHGWDIDANTGAQVFCKCGHSMPNPYFGKTMNPITRMPEEKPND